MQLPLAYVTEELIEELELLEPFGKGNTKPLFAEKLKSTESPCDREESECPEISGSGSKWTENGGDLFRRGTGVYGVSAGKEEVALTFYPSVNEYRGNKSIQITVVNYQ